MMLYKILFVTYFIPKKSLFYSLIILLMCSIFEGDLIDIVLELKISNSSIMKRV